MELNDQEKVLLEKLNRYAEANNYKLNPDEDTVKRVVKGMNMIKDKKGDYYCPCRLVTGKPEIDKKIVCPCDYHHSEIKDNGNCHCQLFFKSEGETASCQN